jgi:hypothetical protein
MKTRRFIISSICAMLVVLGLFLWLIFGFPDHMNPTDPPPTVGHEIVRYVCMIALWPFAITSLILHGDPPLRIYWLLLWIGAVPGTLCCAGPQSLNRQKKAPEVPLALCYVLSRDDRIKKPNCHFSRPHALRIELPIELGLCGASPYQDNKIVDG